MCVDAFTHQVNLLFLVCFSSLAIPSLSLVTLHLGGPLAALPFCTPNDDAERKSAGDTTAKLHCSPANNVLFSTLILFSRHLVNGRPSPSIIPPPLFTVFCLSILYTSERHRDYHRTEPKFVNGGGAILRRLQTPPRVVRFARCSCFSYFASLIDDDTSIIGTR